MSLVRHSRPITLTAALTTARSIVSAGASVLLALTLVLALVLLPSGGAGTVVAGTTGADAPSDLSAEAGSAVVALTWEPPEAPHGRVIWYRVYRALVETPPGSGPEATPEAECVQQVLSDTLAWADYGVMNGLTYGYTVSAVYDDKSESGPSPSVLARPALTGLEVILGLGQATALVDGLEVGLETPAQIVGDRTMVPLRFVGTALGARIDYDARERRVTTSLGQRLVRLWIDRTEAEINGQAVPIDSPPTIIGGRTMVPVRFIAEAFGAQVDFDPESGRITVTIADADASPDAAPELVAGVPVAAALGGPDDVDYYKLPAAVGETYVVRTFELGPGCVTVLTLVDLERGVLDWNEGWFPGTAGSELRFVVPAGDGCSYLRVQPAWPSASGLGGTYKIVAERVLSPEPPGRLAPGDEADGSVGSATDADLYWLEAEAEQVYVITASPLVGKGGGAEGPGPSLVEPLVTVSGPARNGGKSSAGGEGTSPAPLVVAEGPNQPDNLTRIVWQCAADGRYLIRVASAAGRYGPYRLAVDEGDADSGEPDDLATREQASRVVPDRDCAQGWLSSADDQDWYTFKAEAGRRYFIQTVGLSPSADTVLTLYDETGTARLGRDDDYLAGWSLIDWVAPVSGTFYVEVGVPEGLTERTADPGPMGQASGLGSYWFCVTTTGDEFDLSPRFGPRLEPGVPLTRSLLGPDDDYFRFEAVKGVTYGVRTGDLESGCVPCLELWTEDFSRCLGSSGGTLLEWTATFDGTVYLRVYPASAGAEPGSHGERSGEAVGFRTGIYTITLTAITDGAL